MSFFQIDSKDDTAEISLSGSRGAGNLNLELGKNFAQTGIASSQYWQSLLAQEKECNRGSLFDLEQLFFDGHQGHLQVLAVTFVLGGLDVFQYSGFRQEE